MKAPELGRHSLSRNSHEPVHLIIKFRTKDNIHGKALFDCLTNFEIFCEIFFIFLKFMSDFWPTNLPLKDELRIETFQTSNVVLCIS